MAAAIEAAGFRASTAGPVIAEPSSIAPLLPLDVEREARVLRYGFAGRGIARQRAREVRELCEAWQPDLLVCDETDFGALIAGELLDIPYVTVVVVAAGSFLRRDVIAEPLDELRAEHGLAPDPQLEMPTRYLSFAPGPPSFRDPDFPLAPTAHPIRPAALEAAPGEAPPSVPRDGPTTVYFTLGTVFNMESGDLFDRVLRGLRDLPVEVIATVGEQIDPTSFGAQPANVRIARYIPQAEVLPLASVVVSHAGSGTVFGALAYGLPSVLLPMGADQPFNAARCEALGVARVLAATSCTSRDVHDAVAALLAEPSYGEQARKLRDETRELPGATYAVTLLERLAAERLPILRSRP